MKFKRLRAKSWDEGTDGLPPASIFLPQHLKDVHQSAIRVLDSTGDDQLRAVGLSPEEWRMRLRSIVLLAAAVHDLGKANDHFQGMIYHERDVQVNPQGLRHEWVSLLMMQQLREWLLPAVGGSHEDCAIVEWAVCGHHPGHNHASPPGLNPPGAGTTITFLMDHADFGEALSWLKLQFGLAEPPACTAIRRRLITDDNVFISIANWLKKAQGNWDGMKKSNVRFLVPVAKNCLIAADVAGSALPHANVKTTNRWDWITESFQSRPKPGDLQLIVSHRLNGQTPRSFQSKVATSKSKVTYVKAGCGTGKTLAAYMWAANNHSTRRLYFCYPTTGTATEGFKDYLFEPEGELGNIGATLFHSRRDVDFEIILTTGSDTPREAADAALRLDSLESWSTPIVACTVDTVLGIIQNNKRGLFAWPALAQSAFVFDEIHAFDDRLFGALLRFLRDLRGLPVLLMTASLPSAREESLRDSLAKRGEELLPIPGPAALEILPRYHKLAVANNNPLPAVRDTLAQGGKVLWVCNTVSRVMAAADSAAELVPLLYHSRFKYIDRVQRHKKVVESFDPQKNRCSALAICSQVAEMSLDLSADLLVTDLATVAALIQRLGRLNRRATDGDKSKPWIVLEPENHLPYTPPELAVAREWLSRLPDLSISQRDLANCWEQADDKPPGLVPSAWLDGGPVTTVTELREASPGITVLMEEDFDSVRVKPKAVPRYVLPMPPPSRQSRWQQWSRFRGVPVAPAGTIDYNSLRGAKWRKS